MKTMQEALLDMQQELSQQVTSVEKGLEMHMQNMASDFAWLREKLQ